MTEKMEVNSRAIVSARALFRGTAKKILKKHQSPSKHRDELVLVIDQQNHFEVICQDMSLTTKLAVMVFSKI